MRWQGRRRSGNVQDRRGAGPAVAGGAGAIIIALLALVLGVDPGELMQGGGGPAGPAGPAQEPTVTPTGELTYGDDQADFVAVVLADTEETWHELFADAGGQYREPELVLFTDVVNSACGMAQSAVGPFYCPADRMVYLDLGFFRELEQRFGASGDLARAYIIAHEVGHHVQTLLGTTDQVRAAQSRVGQRDANAIQVSMELQADCFAGVWAHHAHTQRQLLEAGDLQSALDAAAAIGDDRLQQQTQGRVVPESFTHGTSAQRMQWFTTGFETGDPAACNTF
ncbi:MAG TPA: neutral zinc metallopeptidase [Longimicrobiales bacterium]|nr:neutral zinc metallopeptidase [Longimicrobiales bacterium]